MYLRFERIRKELGDEPATLIKWFKDQGELEHIPDAIVQGINGSFCVEHFVERGLSWFWKD
jgi:hypothetical protein